MPVPATDLAGENYSAPFTLVCVLVPMLAALGIHFQADTFRQPAIHQSRDLASKRLAPRAVLGLKQQDLFQAASRQIIGPYWLHPRSIGTNPAPE
jgi:hypothetical protein